MQRSKTFERKIRNRDWREIIAAAIVCVVFIWVALHGQNLLQQAGGWIVSASGLWIAYYIRLHRFHPTESDPTVDMQRYTQELLRQYDRQIGLLKTVKYWYLLPLYTGVILGWAGTLQLDRAARWNGPILNITFVTALFGLIWWLNEIHAVRHVQAERARLAALIAER